jgi:hypothetical protein
MDNLEQDPLGEAVDTASSGQSDVETQQPGESTETVVDGEVEESGASNPWDEDDRFRGKGPEDVWKAYQEAEKVKGMLGQKAELANLLEKQTGMSVDAIKSFIAQKQQAAVQAEVQANPVGYVAQELAQLKNQIALQSEEKELDKFLSSDEGKEYAPFRDKIFKLGLQLEKDKPYADIAKEYFGESRAQGQQDAYRKIDRKQGTQATGASQSPPKGRLTLEDMDSMSAKELEQVLPWADISHRL